MAIHEQLPVTTVEYDPDNPRIASLLEGWDEIDHEFLAQALQPNDSKYVELKRAIQTNSGIINPVIVNRTDGKLITIEGNTRLAIYRQFHQEAPEDETWSHIPAVVYDEMSETAIDAIRLQAHLVGVRNWRPYEKARYLYQLSKSDHLPVSALVDFCGGNRLSVIRNIEAYKQMEFKYKPAVEYCDPNKFTLFFEAQKPKIKNAMLREGFKEEDFIDWVIANKFHPRQELIRQLPKIFESPRAREAFLEKGAAEAIKFIDRPELQKELLEASLTDLCTAVQGKIIDLKLSEVEEIKNDEDSSQNIEDAYISLQNFYNNYILS